MSDAQKTNGLRFVTWKEYLITGLSVATGLIGVGALSWQTHAAGTHASAVRVTEYERTTDRIAKQLERIEIKLDRLGATHARQ